MKIKYPEIPEVASAQEVAQTPEPKPIGEPRHILTTFHCEDCRTPFDISIWSTLVRKKPMFDSANTGEKTVDQISS